MYYSSKYHINYIRKIEVIKLASGINKKNKSRDENVRNFCHKQEFSFNPCRVLCRKKNEKNF
jgi:hypothetical protein